MADTTMPIRERELRSTLSNAVTELRTAMGRVPDPVMAASPDDASDALDRAWRCLLTAEASATELSNLEAATEQAALLATSAAMSLTLIRASLTLLVAELDAAA